MIKKETIDHANKVDEKYFGNDVPLLRSVAILSGQVESMFKDSSRANVKDQAGDLIFGLVSMARNQGWDLETLLKEATSKFEQRRKFSHYYESHVTIEPVFGERLEEFSSICQSYRFRVATLLMKKRPDDTPERSADDSFCTGRSASYIDLKTRMNDLVSALHDAGFEVWRAKIESALLDMRYEKGCARTIR